MFIWFPGNYLAPLKGAKTRLSKIEQTLWSLFCFSILFSVSFTPTWTRLHCANQRDTILKKVDRNCNIRRSNCLWKCTYKHSFVCNTLSTIYEFISYYTCILQITYLQYCSIINVLQITQSKPSKPWRPEQVNNGYLAILHEFSQSLWNVILDKYHIVQCNVICTNH